jgi:presenilin-like A22 family membrane protease
MPFDLKNNLPLIAMPAMLLVVELIALFLSRPLQEAGVEALPYSPENPLNVVVFLVLLLVFTLFILVLIRFGVKILLSAIIALSLFFTFYYIFGSLALILSEGNEIAGLASLLLSIGATVLLYWYPEWYVIDTLGILICAGVASIFGIAVGILPALLLLVLLAIYDAISVYRTRHMITLAQGVLSVKAPILFVIPKRRDYSFIREGVTIGAEEGAGAKTGEPEEGGAAKEGEKKERGAFIIGMGDLIMPTILVVSAYVFLPVEGWTVPPPALGAVLGSLAGLALLLRAVTRGKPQAGLPPLNGGTIAGFLIGCAVSGAWSWVPGI